MPGKAIQVRDVPEKVHRQLTVQAAASGRSLSEYLLAELTRIADTPTREEMLQRLRSRAPVPISYSTSELVADDRQRR